jgi:hypothetical protein
MPPYSGIILIIVSFTYEPMLGTTGSLAIKAACDERSLNLRPAEDCATISPPICYSDCLITALSRLMQHARKRFELNFNLRSDVDIKWQALRFDTVDATEREQSLAKPR